MPRAIAETLSFLLISLGTIFLASEAFGRERVLRWENRVVEGCTEAVELIGVLISLFTAPWKDHDVLKEMPAWILPGLGIIAMLSLIGALFATYEFGVLRVLASTFVVWLSSGLASLLELKIVNIFGDIRKSSGKLRDRMIISFCILGIALGGILWLSLLVFLLAHSWPVVLFLAALGMIASVAKAVRRFMIWKSRRELGSGFVMLGLGLSLLGLALDLAADRGLFGE